MDWYAGMRHGKPFAALSVGCSQEGHFLMRKIVLSLQDNPGGIN